MPLLNRSSTCSTFGSAIGLISDIVEVVAVNVVMLLGASCTVVGFVAGGWLVVGLVVVDVGRVVVVSRIGKEVTGGGNVTVVSGIGNEVNNV